MLIARRLITFSRGGSIYEMSLKIVYPQSQSMPAAFPPECLICCKYRKREIWIGGQAVGRPHAVSARGLALAEKALIRDGARYTVSWRPPSKAAAAACWGPDVWSQLVTFEVALRPKLLIEGRLGLLHHWKLSFFNKRFQCARAY